MITEETVFILGAGASAPYGYPTGKQLREDICNHFTGHFNKILNTANPEERGLVNPKAFRVYPDLAKRFQEEFCKSKTESIDLFLANNHQFSELGKIAIALHILLAEYEHPSESLYTVDSDWFLYLKNKMAKGLTDPKDYLKFRNNKVSFITFNYDRSFEHLLYESYISSWTSGNIRTELQLQNSFEPSEKYNTLIPFPIVHVYGNINDIELFGGTEYGHKHDYIEIVKLSQNIRTIHERTDNDYSDIKDILSKSKRIFFLGFGFAEENLKILGLPEIIDLDKEIYGTAYKWTDKETNDLKLLFFNRMGGNKPTIKGEIGGDLEQIRFENQMDCYTLLREYL